MVDDKMKTMKGFIFTVDAIFSLIVASAAVSILIFAYYSPSFSSQEPTSEAYAIAQSLLQTTVGQAAQGINYASYIFTTSSSTQYSWPQYGNNASLSSSTPAYGPQQPLLAWSFRAQNNIYPAPAVADGLVVFTTIGIKSRLYALNATTGNVIVNTSVGGTYVTAPIVFNHMMITGNTLGSITAESESNAMIWSNAILKNTANVVFEGEGGYIEANFTLFNPVNGTVVSSVTSVNSPAAYNRGLYVISPNGAGVANAYFLDGSTLQLGFNTIFSGSVNQIPLFDGNVIIAARGSNVMAITTTGNIVWLVSPGGNTRGSPAALNGNVYFETTTGLYAYNQSGKQLWSDPIPTSGYNVTPTVTPTTLYTVIAGNVFQAYNIQSGKLLWNVTLQSGNRSIIPFSAPAADIPVAYGFAYVASGNVLFAFSSCKTDPGANLLQAMATFYSMGEAGCADVLLNKSAGTNKVGIFVNNLYGPSMVVDTFTGYSSTSANYIAAPTNGRFYNNSTISFWMYPSRVGNGDVNIANVYSESLVSIGNINTQTTNVVDVYWSGNGVIGVTTENVLGNYYSAGVSYNLLKNEWDHVVAVYNNGVVTLYINGKIAYSLATYNKGLTILNPTVYISNPRPYNVQQFYINYGGVMANVQVYNSTLNKQQVTLLYQEGIGGTPVQGKSLVGWWPLLGDSNDYSGNGYVGFPSNVSVSYAPFTPVTLSEAYEVSMATIPLNLNLTGGIYKSNNVSVVVWR